MYDSFGREITYLRISVTDRCNLRCVYCMPEEGIPLKTHDDLLSLETIRDVVAEAAYLGVNKVRFTGGEPLLRRGIVDLVRMVAGLEGIDVLGMTTNGVLLPRYADALRDAGLNRLNISIDTLDPERYTRITRWGRLEAALAGAAAAKKAGFTETKVNMVIMEDTTEAEVNALRSYCAENGFRLQRIAEYNLRSDKFDPDDLERPRPCRECNRIRMLSDGTLKPCLHSNVEIPLNRTDIRGSLIRAIETKPEHGTVCTNRSMMEIGG